MNEVKLIRTDTMGDPLFERRTLVRNVHIDAKFLQRNIQSSLVAQLRMKYEGVCVAEGYIQRRSITVIEHSLGRTNLIKGGLDYTVKFQADVCMPHPKQVFRMPVTLKSKIGIHAELTPIKALLPRDLHIGLDDFDGLTEGQEIEFEVEGARFQQGDETIVVLGKLRSIIRAQGSEIQTTEVGDGLPLLAAPVPGEGESAVKKVTVDLASTKGPEASARKRRVRLNPEAKLNEPKPQGTVEGKA
jgi:DNA-directed RNA polymerase subunit E'/Rpb7